MGFGSSLGASVLRFPVKVVRVRLRGSWENTLMAGSEVDVHSQLSQSRSEVNSYDTSLAFMYKMALHNDAGFLLLSQPLMRKSMAKSATDQLL